VDTDRALASANAKLGRAREHLRIFYETVDRFLERKPYGFTREFQDDGRQEFFRLKRNEWPTDEPWPPDRLSLIYGDVLHNARDALDHAVYGLATENQPSLSDGDRGQLQFPIVRSLHDFQNQKRRGRLCGVPAQQRTVIQRVQPYNPGGWPNYLLGILANLNNTDKHRTVHVVAVSIPFVTSADSGNKIGFPGDRFLRDENAVIAIAMLAEPYVKVDEFNPEFDLAIEEAQLPIGIVESAKSSLASIVRAVRETLLRLA